MDQQETSQSIAEWAENAFGPVRQLGDLARRAGEELDELKSALRDGESSGAIVAEAADVVILLHRIAALSGHDLSQAVTHKMQINRSRRWVRSNDGTGQHVEEQ